MVLISSVLAVVLAILFARAITQPLQTVAHVATHIFDDAVAERLPVGRSDEIGILARCFDCMRVEIRMQMGMLRAKQQALTHLAGHDVLTGLPNRLLFMERLDGVIRHASATGEGLAVMFIDLDRFKQINDQLGHSAGDQALVAVAKRLNMVLRSGDMAARLDGDEFIVLSANVRSPEVVGDFASRIQVAMAEELEFGERRMTVDASIGVSEFPVDGGSAEELLVKADAAMYEAKTSRHAAYLRYQETIRVTTQRGTASPVTLGGPSNAMSDIVPESSAPLHRQSEQTAN